MPPARVRILMHYANQPPALALAFSGGLDTSYCVPRLAEEGWAVHTVYVDTGGATAEERAAIRRQAERSAPWSTTRWTPARRSSTASSAT